MTYDVRTEHGHLPLEDDPGFEEELRFMAGAEWLELLCQHRIAMSISFMLLQVVFKSDAVSAWTRVAQFRIRINRPVSCQHRSKRNTNSSRRRSEPNLLHIRY
jgi:hypothetical protein